MSSRCLRAEEEREGQEGDTEPNDEPFNDHKWVPCVLESLREGLESQADDLGYEGSRRRKVKFLGSFFGVGSLRQAALAQLYVAQGHAVHTRPAEIATSLGFLVRRNQWEGGWSHKSMLLATG